MSYVDIKNDQITIKPESISNLELKLNKEITGKDLVNYVKSLEKK